MLARKAGYSGGVSLFLSTQESDHTCAHAQLIQEHCLLVDTASSIVTSQIS